MNKQRLLKGIFSVWLILWVFFLIREDKDGQYGSLAFMYTHGGKEGMRHLYGEGLYDLAVYCAKNMRERSTYIMMGFDRFSIDEVRIRYLLWPLRQADRDADYIVMRGDAEDIPGYEFSGKAGYGMLWAKRSVRR
jgi:hypothetical protein